MQEIIRTFPKDALIPSPRRVWALSIRVLFAYLAVGGNFLWASDFAPTFEEGLFGIRLQPVACDADCWEPLPLPQSGVRLASFDYFENAELERLAFEDPPMPPKGDEAGKDAPKDGGKGTGKDAAKIPDKELGQAPPDNSRLFLRSATVLLQPGHWDFDYGIHYTIQDSEQVVIIPSIPAISLQRNRNREIFVPFAFRYGISSNAQGFVNFPVGVAIAEKQNIAIDEFEAIGGLGDISSGVTFLLQKHDKCQPDVILTITNTAPTGVAPFSDTTDNVPSMGRGFWGLGCSLGFVKSIDPAAIYGSIGYEHEFSHRYFGRLFQPGENISYQFGVGFAINDVLTLSTTFLGAIQTEWTADQEPLPGTVREPLALRFALTASVSPCMIVEPFAVIGMTEDAPPADVGVTITRRF